MIRFFSDNASESATKKKPCLETAGLLYLLLSHNEQEIIIPQDSIPGLDTYYIEYQSL
jgi:hypothetical protein